MGPVSVAYHPFADATWNERLAAILLISAILLMGIAPFLVNALTSPGAEHIFHQLNQLSSTK
jgi:NADH:ubiquinone oxidoreductase subunit 4 (subunit M)